MRKPNISKRIVAVVLSCLMVMSTVSTAVFAEEEAEPKTMEETTAGQPNNEDTDIQEMIEEIKSIDNELTSNGQQNDASSNKPNQGKEMVAKQVSDAQRYTITLPTHAGYTITTEDALELEQGETFTFAITMTDGYMKMKSFKVKANGTIVTPNEEGFYEVEIQDHTTITVEGVTKISKQESDFVTVKPGGFVMTYREGVEKTINKTLTIEAGGKLINQGVIIMKGVFTNEGILDNQGKLYMEIGSTLIGIRPNNMYFQIGWDIDGDGEADTKEYVLDGEMPFHEDVNIPADAQYTYTFEGWSTDGGVTTEAIGPATEAKVYTAKISKTLNQYDITLPEQTEGYTLTHEGETTLGYGQTFSFAINLADGYMKLKDFAVKANGVVLEPVEGRYELTVQEDTEITVKGIAEIVDTAVEDLVVDSESTMTIAEEEILTVSGELVVNGSLDVEGVLINNGTIVCNGTVSRRSGAVMRMRRDFILDESMDIEGTLINNGTIIANGVINNNGTFINHDTVLMNLGSSLNGEKPDNLFYQIGWDTDGNGVADTKEYVLDGKLPSHTDVSKDPTVDTVYTFNGWLPAVVEASAPTLYTAQFTASPRLYAITLPQQQTGYAIRYEGTTAIEYNQTFTFTVDMQDGYVKTKDFTVQANGIALSANEDGSYTTTIQSDTKITVVGVKAASQPATADSSDITLWLWLVVISSSLLIGNQMMSKKKTYHP